MSVADLEQTLRNLQNAGTLVKDRGYRQIWRFEHAGRGYFLKFYPRGRWLKRLVRGNPAMREFVRLQALQKAQLPAPRAVAGMLGFQIGQQRGDAVILEAIEPAVPLDRYFNQHHLAGEVVPNRRDIAQQIRTLVHNLGKAGLGHCDLHLGNFLLKGGKVFLIDGYSVRMTGLKLRDVYQLGHSTARYATTTDLLRGWKLLSGRRRLPERNPLSPRIWAKLAKRVRTDNRHFGNLTMGAWSGHFFRSSKYPHRSSLASQLQISREQWETAWPKLLAQIEGGQLPAKKRGRSGDVLLSTVRIGGRDLDVVIKQPRRRYWYRYINEIGRGARCRRAWFKAWDLIARNIPSAWPLLLMEKRRFGYATDGVIVFERVPGIELALADLDEMEPGKRQMLFRRTGRLLRKIDRQGLGHFDAKSSNWIVMDDPKLGLCPILVDIDGIRYRRWVALGIERLLRSMQQHKQYTPADSKSLCEGYAPDARLVQKEETQNG